jgi:phage shock protein A
MNMFKKLLTAVRGGANEVGEAIIDHQAIRILEQELRDAKNALNESKTNLTTIMAEKIGIDRKVNELIARIKENEGYAMKALEKQDENLAHDVAVKIAGLEHELVVQKGIMNGYESKVTNLKKLIRQAEHNIQTMEREITVIITTEKVQQANDLASSRYTGSNSALQEAMESAERIKKRQQEREDRVSAALELESEQSSQKLEDRLKAAGIIEPESSAKSVLERLKKQQHGNG